MVADPAGGPLTWSVAAASVAGNSHTAVGRGSDDAYSYALVSGGTGLVAAVADGAGSKTGTSAWGSFTACQVVAAHADGLVASVRTKSEAESALRNVFGAVLSAIEEQAGRMNLAPSDLSTTLAVAVLGPSAGAFAQVGDGIVVCDLVGEPSVRIAEDKGEYANETAFVTSSGALKRHLRLEYRDAGTDRFALSTDGLRYKLLNIHDGGTAFVPFFTSLWDKLEVVEIPEDSLSAFLAKLDDQTGDDKTLIVGTRTRLDAHGARARLAGVRASSPPPVASGEVLSPGASAAPPVEEPTGTDEGVATEDKSREKIGKRGLLRRWEGFL